MLKYLEKVNNITLLIGTLAPARLRAVARPSGILCNPITMASVIPKSWADIKDDPIANPSGKLCINILIKIKYPDFIFPVNPNIH